MDRRERLLYSLLHSDTDYAELILGTLSLLLGLWLQLSWAHCHFHTRLSWLTESLRPEVMGVMLIGAGILKYVGVIRGRRGLRRISCMLAAWVWFFVGLMMLLSNLPLASKLCNPLAPLALLFGAFNAIIYLKLSLTRP